MRPAKDGLDLSAPYVGPVTAQPVITPQYTGEDLRKGADPGRGYMRWQDIPKAERDRLSVVTCICQMWNQHGKIPTIDMIMGYKKMDRQTVQTALDHPKTLVDLRHHGIISDEAETWAEAANEVRAGLTYRQVEAARAYMERAAEPDRRSLAATLEQVHVTPTEWNSWCKDPVFMGYLNSLGERLFDQYKLDIDMAMVREASAGDVPAARLIYEATGRIKNKEQQFDQTLLIARVFEILARYVPPELQEQVSRELVGMSDAIRNNAGQPRMLEGQWHESVPAEDQRSSGSHPAE